MSDIVYELASKKTAAYTKGLMMIWDKLGQPTDCSVPTGWLMMDNIMQIWAKEWPQEKSDWIHQIKTELTLERSVQEALKANGGYFPMSYPTRLYNLIHAMLPNQKLNDKEFIRHMIFRYPFLKSTNYKV